MDVDLPGQQASALPGTTVAGVHFCCAALQLAMVWQCGADLILACSASASASCHFTWHDLHLLASWLLHDDLPSCTSDASDLS